MGIFGASSRAALLGALLVSGIGASPARADLTDCKSIYVMRLFVDTAGVTQVMFANSPTDTTGSHPVYLPTMPDRVYQQIFAMLLTAKSARLPVDVTTNGAGSCGITAGGTSLTNLELRATP
jgi:hypothetical protein